MKKLLYLFSAALVLVSCTNDYDASCFKKNVNPIKNDTILPPKKDSIPLPNIDSIPVIVEPILLKKLVYTSATGYISTIELLYDGIKIVSDKDASNLTFFTYTGDVITKIEKADLSGNVYITKKYFYENGKVDYILLNQFGSYFKIKYTYNSDGSISYERLNSDSLGNDLGSTPISGRYTFSGGNLIKHELSNGNSDLIYTYEYDSKNNPRINILGGKFLIDQLEFGVNNPTKRTITNVQSEVSDITRFSYEYDANGYPTSVTSTTENGTQVTIETFDYSY